MVWVAEDTDEKLFYHKGTSSRPDRIPMNERYFVVWDSEGTKDPFRRNGPTFCSLFGCYNGKTHECIKSSSLRSLAILDFIMEQGRQNPGGIHVAFAFSYDVNMILKGMPFKKWILLNKNHSVFWSKYRIEFLPGKWFRLSLRGENYDREHNPMDKETVTIFDVWGFFQASLKAALDKNLKGHPIMDKLALISEGKGRRDTFTYKDIDFIEEYWAAENEATWHLVNNLRENLYRAGYLITSWHGPGAIANYVLKHQHIEKHMSDDPPELIDACRYGYAGGRFEMYNIGRHVDAYSMDIRSAYPSAIRHIPSWANGHWRHINNPSIRDIVKLRPQYALFHIRLNAFGEFRQPSPFFHRDDKGNITFPWTVDGWYWSPEIMVALKYGPRKYLQNLEILEVYIFQDDGQRPFAFVEEMYVERNRLKQIGDGAEKAHKLAMNSLYGKTAQRAGYERNGKPPKWHDLKTAGYITSHARATLYRVMAQMPVDELVAVETDGLYTRSNPEKLGIVDSPELGGWEVTKLDEIVYLQSGVYAKKIAGGKWETKYRGLDKGSVSAPDIVRHSTLLLPCHEWPPLVGTTTRFIGSKRAMMQSQADDEIFRQFHTQWITEPREIGCGTIGKRVHTSKVCKACTQGLSAYDMPHELVVNTRATLQPKSQRHDIPWIEDDVSKWREDADEVIYPEW